MWADKPEQWNIRNMRPAQLEIKENGLKAASQGMARINLNYTIREIVQGRSTS